MHLNWLSTHLPILFYVLIYSCCDGQLLESIYCGKRNCYDILGVTREANKSAIARSYRRLAREFHPDLHRTVSAKKEAEEQFKIVATAYEILKDDESRNDYDYMLDNPDVYYAHYYRYYRRRMAPKVDVRIVIFVTITVISVIQYFSAKQRYDSAIKYFMTVPKYRNHALEIAKEENLMQSLEKRGKRSKQEIKDETERIIQSVIENKMDIKGSYAKPSVMNILWIQLLVSPYTITKNAIWYAKFWRKKLKKEPQYTLEEQLYMIRRNLNLGVHQFESLEDDTREEYLRRKLWIWKNFETWKKEEQENLKVKLAESNKYKQYRRYVKKVGFQRMTFDDS